MSLCWTLWSGCPAQALRPERSCSQLIFNWNAVETIWSDILLLYPEDDAVLWLLVGPYSVLCHRFPSRGVQSVCPLLPFSGKSSDLKPRLPVLVEKAALSVGFSKQNLSFLIQNNMTFVFCFRGSRC